MGLSVLLLASACTDDYVEWATPQSNSETAKTVGFIISPVEAIDLAADSLEYIQIFVPQIQAEEGSTVLYDVTVTKEDGTAPVLISADKNGYVSKDDVQEIVTSYYGKRPVPRTLNLDVAALVTKNGQTVRKQVAPITLQVTPVAPFISSGYYLVGDMVGWDGEGAVKNPFIHSLADVYDDPVFSIVFTTTADNQYWKIIPQENVDAGNIWLDGVVGVEVDGDDSAEGRLINVDAKAGKIPTEGTYRMTINMMDYTYTITAVPSIYFVTGSPNSWTSDNISAFLPNSDGTQEFTTYWTGAWDLKAWGSDDVGNWDKAIGSAIDGDGSPSGSLVTSNAQAFQSPEAGFYTLSVDFKALTYQWIRLDNQSPSTYNQISLSGDLNGWGDTDMTQVGTSHNWYIHDVAITGSSIKFKANHDWAVNWGAGLNIADQAFGSGTQDGPNITIEEGTYDVYFCDITGKFLFIKK